MITMRHFVNNNTRMGLVISLCSNSNHLISLIPPERPQILDVGTIELRLLANGSENFENEIIMSFSYVFNIDIYRKKSNIIFRCKNESEKIERHYYTNNAKVKLILKGLGYSRPGP